MQRLIRVSRGPSSVSIPLSKPIPGIFLFGFKFYDSACETLGQIHEKGNAFPGETNPIPSACIGVAFDETARNLAAGSSKSRGLTA